MFLVASKILLFLIRPFNWIVVFLLYALFGKKEKWKKYSFYLAAGLFFFFSNPFLFNLAVGWWEYKPVTFNSIQHSYDIGIVLGGYTSQDSLISNDRLIVGGGANRLIAALELYHQKKIGKILLSGGAVDPEKKVESLEVKAFLLRMGVEDSDIIVDPDSRNTRENALYSSRLIRKEYPDANCLLISSAWHLRRAKACFNKAGLYPEPFPVDPMVQPLAFNLKAIIIPNLTVMERWNYLIKEWVGYLSYKLAGYL